jgi:hypothetical protein
MLMTISTAFSAKKNRPSPFEGGLLDEVASLAKAHHVGVHVLVVFQVVPQITRGP